MFEKIRSAIKSVAVNASRRIVKKDNFKDILAEFEFALIESDVSPDISEALTNKVRESLERTKIDSSVDLEQYIKEQLQEAVKQVINEIPGIDLFKMINETKNKGMPFKMIFLGINGTGKTTTIAKMGKLLKNNGFSVVFGSADTHRAGAIEQLKEHSERLSLKIISQNYGADPAAVARDTVLYAQSHRIDVVLIDTAGRMQTSKNLMEELAKIINVISPDLKVFVCDSLAGSDAISQAKEFLKYTDFDGTILTKIDADAKGGAALSIINVSRKPIIFLGIGQDYEHLIPFDIDNFVSSIFNVG